MENGVQYPKYDFRQRLKGMLRVGLISPLGSTLMNVALCLAGGLLFALGLGAVSNTVMKKTSLV